MTKDKISETAEFEVLYADGTSRHVREGILFEVEDDIMTFHNGTNRGGVLFAAAECALELIDSIGLTKLFGRYIRCDPRDQTTLRIVHRLAEPPENGASAMGQSLYRLGQMDMRASVAAMLRDQAKASHGVARTELLEAAERVEKLEALHE